MRSLWTAATGMAAQQTNMDVIANNLANANTTGFKASRANFQDLMYQTLVPAGAQTSAGTTIPTGVQIGMGTKTSRSKSFSSRGISPKPTTIWTWQYRATDFSRSFAALSRFTPAPAASRPTRTATLSMQRDTRCSLKSPYRKRPLR